jgi:hypothetical protein
MFLGRVFAAMDDQRGALVHYEIAIGLDASSSFTWGHLSAALISIGNPRDGLLAAEIAMELNPREPDHVRLRDIARERLARSGSGR